MAPTTTATAAHPGSGGADPRAATRQTHRRTSCPRAGADRRVANATHGTTSHRGAANSRAGDARPSQTNRGADNSPGRANRGANTGSSEADRGPDLSSRQAVGADSNGARQVQAEQL